ncbi:MAG: hypothetical protein GY719_09695 [bacterium]|nr:hypothetical protein [bacterium]
MNPAFTKPILGVLAAIAYELFAFGTKTGALGIENTAVYGPEVGIVGLALNLAFATLLWLGWRRFSVRSAK